VIELPDLVLEIESVTDMDMEKAAAVGRAYDADPELRPVRVGGDPARVKVEGSLEELIGRTGLPIDWLTVRVNTRAAFEGGEIVLRPGRGGYIGWPNPDGTKRFTLVPNQVVHSLLRSWADAEPDRLDRVAALFTRLCDAIDACYGAATLLPRKRSLPPTDAGIGDIGWLNCFGPAFVERFPKLLETGAETTRLANGGVVIRIAASPWDLDDAAKQPVIDALGNDAILRSWESDTPRAVHVPGYEDHMRHSPGTMEMPWIRGEIERAAANAARTQERRYASARERRRKAQEGRDSLPAVERTAEWSTSFDTDDWRSFGPRLFRRLGGELAGPIGKALIGEIAAAPLNHEESVVLASDIGPVEIRWFIDDVDTVDLYLFGSDALPPLVDAVHERWSIG
jgi:hypothetical protein